MPEYFYNSTKMWIFFLLLIEIKQQSLTTRISINYDYVCLKRTWNFYLSSMGNICWMFIFNWTTSIKAHPESLSKLLIWKVFYLWYIHYTNLLSLLQNQLSRFCGNMFCIYFNIIWFKKFCLKRQRLLLREILRAFLIVFEKIRKDLFRKVWVFIFGIKNSTCPNSTRKTWINFL